MGAVFFLSGYIKCYDSALRASSHLLAHRYTIVPTALYRLLIRQPVENYCHHATNPEETENLN